MSSLKENISIKSLNNSRLIFNIAFLMQVLKTILAFSEFIPFRYHGIINGSLNAVFLALLAFKVFYLQKYSIKQIFILLIIGLASIYTDFSTDRFVFIPDFIMLAATQESDIKSNMNFIWKVEAFIIGFHVLIYPVMLAFRPWRITYTVRGYNDDNAIRHHFMLSHANVFSMILMWTILAYIYANFEKMNKKRIIICWAVYAIFFQFTDSNSGMIILSAIAILLLLRQFFKDIMDKVISFLSKYLFIILAIFFNVMMISYPYLNGGLRDAWRLIDSFFTGRLKYGAYVFAKHGMTLLGRPLDVRVREFWQGFWIEGVPADNMYMFFSVRYGLLFLIIIAFLFWKYSDAASIDEKIIIIAYSLYTMMESYIIYCQLCFALLLVMKYVWKDYSIKLSRGLHKRYPDES